MLAVFVVALDWLTKTWAQRALAGGNTVAVVPGYVHLSLVLNRGSAFGIVRQGSAILAAIALVAIALMIYVERRGLPHGVVRVAVALQLGGALGNLADRVRLGYVVDFVELDWRGRNIWPVFNVADSAITIGTVLLIYWLWRMDHQPKARPAS